MIILNQFKTTAFNLKTHGIFNKSKINTPVSTVQGAHYSNLTSLPKDTFAFTGKDGSADKTEKINQIAASLMTIGNLATCKAVSSNAEQATDDLYSWLNLQLKDLIATKKYPDRPIGRIIKRTKAPESINEKIASVLARRMVEKGQVFDLFDIEDIKENVGDIVGVRIILKNPNHPDTKKIITKLADAIKNDKNRFLRIKKIESYEQDQESAYFKTQSLNELRDAENTHRDRGNRIAVSHNKKKTGYTAVHIDVDISNPHKYTSNQDNYSGEIQIIGEDVSELKGVEDLCYKLKKGDRIKGGNVAYEPFSKYFLHYYEGSPQIKSSFVDYTQKAYKIQRKREPGYKNANSRKYQFPTIEECKMAGRVPEELNFNRLHYLKILCDKIYESTKNLT